MGHNRPVQVLMIGPVKLASFHIGLLQPFNYLKEQGICDFRKMEEDEVTKRDLRKADLVIFSRTIKRKAYECFKLALEMGKRTVYVIDDHFLAIPNHTELGKSLQDETYRRIYIRFLKRAHIVKVASPFFKEHLKRHFHPRKVVCFPGSVDFTYLDRLTRNNRLDGRIVIGYAGGRKETAFIPVVRALKRLIRRYGDRVRIEFFGYIPDKLKGLAHVTHIPHQPDYKTYLQYLYQSAWDIGIAPLERALYHDCKTDNKFREYAACLIPGIYSNTPVFNSVVQDRQTGLLVGPSHEDWYAALREMMDNAELRETIQKQASQVARERYSIPTCAEQWKKLILHR